MGLPSFSPNMNRVDDWAGDNANDLKRVQTPLFISDRAHDASFLNWTVSYSRR
jgi:hypothetical protein